MKSSQVKKHKCYYLNKQEIEQARQRDRGEMHEMVQKHLKESRELHKTLKFYKQQQRLFYAMQQYEKLKQQQAEQQRIAAFNSAFNAKIQVMQYSLNGVPMYKIAISDPPLDVNAYRKTLSYQSSATLIKAIRTKPTKGQKTTATDLAKSTSTISEILKRAGVKAPPPKKEQQKTPKPKPS